MGKRGKTPNPLAPAEQEPTRVREEEMDPLTQVRETQVQEEEEEKEGAPLPTRVQERGVFCNAFIFTLSAMTIFAFSRAWARTASWAGVRSLRPRDIYN
jgi:hypothetical protein